MSPLETETPASHALVNEGMQNETGVGFMGRLPREETHRIHDLCTDHAQSDRFKNESFPAERKFLAGQSLALLRAIKDLQTDRE
jgi:hypothetical protein